VNLERTLKKMASRALPGPVFSDLLGAYGALKWRAAQPVPSPGLRHVVGKLRLEEDEAGRKRLVRDLYRNRERWSVAPSWKSGFVRYWRRVVPDEVVGEQYLEEARQQGRGIIFLSSHVGAWRALPWSFQDMGLSLDLSYPIQWPHRVKKGSSARSFIREAVRVLAEGGNVGIMGDGSQGRNRAFTLLGQEVLIATGFAQLARRTLAPVLPFFLIRDGNGRHRLVLQPPIHADHYQGDKREAAAAMTARYLSCLEEMILAYPCNAPAYLLGSRLTLGHADPGGQRRVRNRKKTER
jgi:KDO2-lipid IV(A) lauroyltransferase